METIDEADSGLQRRPRRILVVDDDETALDLMDHALSRDGFCVVRSRAGQEALEAARRERPDLILLDLLLPDMDGVEVCRLLKWEPATRWMPIIMVSARDDEADVVTGLGMGADDYICKPFRPNELLARVQSVLRRSQTRAQGEGTCVERGPLAVDVDAQQASIEGRRLDLTPTEFRLLLALAARPSHAFTRVELCVLVSRQGDEITERTIDVHVQSVRKKLGGHRGLIVTVRGTGYRLNLP